MSLFSDRLVFARKKSGLTQQDIAKHFTITRSAYSAWEVGRNEPSFEILLELCKKLNVSADYLIGVTDSIATPVVSEEEKLPTDGTLKVKRPRNPLDDLHDEYLKSALDYIEFQRQKQLADLAESKSEAK